MVEIKGYGRLNQFLEIFEELVGTYKSNKEDLERVRIEMEEGVNEDVSCVSECFEQGFNNALELVFDKFGIKYEYDFESLLEDLKEASFEDVMKKLKTAGNEFAGSVECIKNDVYDDEDLYEFLDSIYAEIIAYDRENDSVFIRTKNKIYKVPCEDRQNRFDDDSPDETVLMFNHIALLSDSEEEKTSIEELVNLITKEADLDWDEEDNLLHDLGNLRGDEWLDVVVKHCTPVTIAKFMYYVY